MARSKSATDQGVQGQVRFELVTRAIGSSLSNEDPCELSHGWLGILVNGGEPFVDLFQAG